MISLRELKRRRNRLIESMTDDSVAILPTARVYARNRDSEFAFRPDSDFVYLTGFAEPESVLVIVPGRASGEWLLFCRERNAEQERWTGLRHGVEAAGKKFGFDDAFPIEDIDHILPGLMEGRSRVFYDMGYDEIFDRRMVSWVNRLRAKVRAGICAPAEFVSLQHHLHELRLIKSAEEIKVMRKAAEISAHAHIRAMQACKPGKYEYELEAELTYHFMRNGSRSPAYSSIVAGGANALILHYNNNDAALKSKDMVLIDAGCELDFYASDITRTFPIGGKFSKGQRLLYELVLEAQKQAIAAAKPGNTWNAPHAAAVDCIVDGLLDLGLLKGKKSTILKKRKYLKFYMHNTGHWIGLDVHDVGDYKVGGEWRELEPGMCLTIEPGLYIDDGKGIPKQFMNQGIRIEDDIVITKTGCEVLTSSVPKEVDEIEALVGIAN